MKTKSLLYQSISRVRRVRHLRKNFCDSLSKMPLNRAKVNAKIQLPGWVLFTRETLQNYRTMGAPWASSQWLARTIASAVPLTKPGFVVELGSGTGKITEALLQQGVLPERFVSIEQSASLVKYLRQRCPQVRVIKGDAQNLCDLLGNDCHQVSTVVSSLPFRSLPQAVGQSIIKQLDKVIPNNGLFIQFTYDLSGRMISLPSHFKPVSCKFVWRNMPPARVDVFRSER